MIITSRVIRHSNTTVINTMRVQAKIGTSHGAEIKTIMSKSRLFSFCTITPTDISLGREQKPIYIAHAFALNNKICAKRFLTGRDSRARFFSLSDKKRRLDVGVADITRTIRFKIPRTLSDAALLQSCTF